MTVKKSTKKPAAESTPELRAELAALIVRLLEHPLTPARLYNDVADFINDESSETLGQMYHEADFIERVLERGGCGYILCPGKRGGVCSGPQSHKKGGAR
jgi:hypothetical protein